MKLYVNLFKLITKYLKKSLKPIKSKNKFTIKYFIVIFKIELLQLLTFRISKL